MPDLVTNNDAGSPSSLGTVSVLYVVLAFLYSMSNHMEKVLLRVAGLPATFIPLPFLMSRRVEREAVESSSMNIIIIGIEAVRQGPDAKVLV